MNWCGYLDCQNREEKEGMIFKSRIVLILESKGCIAKIDPFHHLMSSANTRALSFQKVLTVNVQPPLKMLAWTGASAFQGFEFGLEIQGYVQV